MSTNPQKRIVILGGGFAGLYAAMELEKTLARNPEVEITLVNRENFFLFTPMLHEVAASDLDITAIVNPLRKMFKRIRFFEGEVEYIDLSHKKWLSLMDLKTTVTPHLRSSRNRPGLDHKPLRVAGT